MKQKSFNNSDAAEAIALRMLAYLASDDERLEAFLKLTGIAPGRLKDVAADPQFLAGVMDHLLADQSLLLAFCAEAEVNPESAVKARRHLPGAPGDF